MIKKRNAYRVYLIYSGVTAFLFTFIFTVSQLYRINIVQLNKLELVIVGTVLELTCFLFEIPTGIVADLKSRKLSIIIGLFLLGVGFLVEAIFPFVFVVIISQVIWGLGYTFTSGADEAWIADELNNENLEHVYLRGAQIGQVFSFMGIILSSLIGLILINLPMIIGGVLFMLFSLALVFIMPEENFHKVPKDERTTWQQMFQTFRSGVHFIRGKTILILMVFISLFYGLYSEGFDRLWEAHFIEDIGFPNFIQLEQVIWFGIINALAMILSILAVEYIKRQLKKTGRLQKAWLLILINILMVLSIIVFGFAGYFELAFMMYLTFYIVRMINGPIYRAWLNENIESNVRATVLSTFGQIDALGQIIGGPIIGYIALKVSIALAIVVAGIILTPTIILYLFTIPQIKHNEEDHNEI